MPTDYELAAMEYIAKLSKTLDKVEQALWTINGSLEALVNATLNQTRQLKDIRDTVAHLQ